MNNLFDNTEKLVKFNRSLSQQLQIKHVLNPFTKSFIDVQLANKLGILCNGYYRNRNGELIAYHIAASKGLIEFIVNHQTECEEMEIEYRSKDGSIITNLLIHQVYDSINQCMITFRQAIDNDYLDTELFLYSCSDISMSIHEAFYHGLIVGELRTNRIEQILSPKQMSDMNDTLELEQEKFSVLTDIVNSLSEFTDMINIIDECELTSNGYIQHRPTGICYLLTQALELGLVSFKENHSTSINDMTSSEMDTARLEETIPEENAPLILDTFIFN